MHCLAMTKGALCLGLPTEGAKAKRDWGVSARPDYTQNSTGSLPVANQTPWWEVIYSKNSRTMALLPGLPYLHDNAFSQSVVCLIIIRFKIQNVKDFLQVIDDLANIYTFDRS